MLCGCREDGAQAEGGYAARDVGRESAGDEERLTATYSDFTGELTLTPPELAGADAASATADACLPACSWRRR